MATTAAPTTTVRTTTAAPTTTAAAGTVAQYGQCGGIGYSGPTGCVSPFTCKVLNGTPSFLSLNNHLQVLILRIRRLLLAMRVISSYHSSPAQHTTTSSQTHDPVPHCISHFPTTTRARRRDKEHGTGWTRFDDRAKALGASAAVSVFFWLVFSRKLSSVVHV